MLNILILWYTTSPVIQVSVGLFVNSKVCNLQNFLLVIIMVTVTNQFYTLYICDPLSENPAHPAFYENRDKTGDRYIDV